MLQQIARMAIRAPKRIVVIALLVMVATGIFGIPVTQEKRERAAVSVAETG